MKRNIITIDETKCTGCGLCIPNCPEGAIQIIDNKACLVSDLSCDGLGACIGYCPEGAITIEEREAVPYDERTVIKKIIKQGSNVIEAHLKHLHTHKQQEYLQQALDELKREGITVSSPMITESTPPPRPHDGSGCPESRSVQFTASTDQPFPFSAIQPSALRHWPIQMHLIAPTASQYKGADLLLAADCVAYSLGNFHRDYLNGKSLAIACPKLDSGREIYCEKLRMLIDDAKISTITVMIMEVPCCSGLLNLVNKAATEAHRKVPITVITVGTDGRILHE